MATPYEKSLHSSGSHRWWQLNGDVRYRPLKKYGPTAAAYILTMSSRTSSRYQTAVTKPGLNMCRSMRFPDEIPAHTIMLPLQNAWYSVMFWGWLRVPCSRHNNYTLVICFQGKSWFIIKHDIAPVTHSPIALFSGTTLIVLLLIGRIEKHKLEAPRSTVHSYIIFSVQ